MRVPKLDSPEEEIKEWLSQIALICLSEDFQKLKKELENIYSRSNVEDFKLVAFQDALYAFLAQEEEGTAVKSGRC
ncbi:MAG: hypothetical protein ACOY40_18560 [Bacillota bacterium]